MTGSREFNWVIRRKKAPVIDSYRIGYFDELSSGSL